MPVSRDRAGVQLLIGFPRVSFAITGVQVYQGSQQAWRGNRGAAAGDPSVFHDALQF